MRAVLVAVALLWCSTAYAADRAAGQALSRYIMGLYYERTGDTDRAIASYKGALKADASSVAVRIGLASSYIKKSDYAHALEELLRAYALDPDAVEPPALLTLVYGVQNRAQEAGRFYETALRNAAKLEPANVAIYKSLGTLYLQQEKFAEAEKTFRLILELAPRDQEAYFFLANACERRADVAAAEKYLLEALAIDPEYTEAMNYLGYLYIEQNRHLAKAEALVRKALSIEPDNGAYVDSMGWWYFKKGDYAKALQYLERAATLIDDPVVLDHLGETYIKLNDPAQARNAWQKALELDPTLKSIGEKLKTLP